MSEETATTETLIPAVKKIKVVVSDLHLGKGRVLPNGGVNALEEFYYAEKLVEFIHYYTSGIFRDYEVELIINGDFLNFLQVDYRGHFLTVLTEAVCLEVLESIIQGHQKVFKAMSEFALKAGNSVTYIVGNHDQAMLWPACRQRMNQAVGVPVRFKNIVHYFDGVHIEHGHMHEAANRLDPRKFFLKKDLAEPILNLPFGSHFFVGFVLKVKENYPFVDKIRPFSKMFRWSLINEFWMTVASLIKLNLYIAKSIFGKDPRKNWGVRKLFQIFLESAIFPDLSDSARKILGDDRVHTVIFGHTHVYQYRQWSSDKEYFNTGTWTEITSLDIVSLGKITKLTYVLIEYPDDGGRPRARLKEWRGYHRIEEDVAVS
jgi:UDP-2,3-diacylglucosamine pyrophosphatase LpxH